MNSFLEQYAKAAMTSLGFFWMALWAFVLGYVVSSMIQVFVTQDKMKQSMGRADSKAVLLGTFFGFISSSCSFAALATTKSLFKKGAGFVPSIAFLLASTNLVIELGIIISIFLAWQFVVGEYVGGLLLIIISWMLVRLTNPKKLIKSARERLGDEESSHAHHQDWKKQITSISGWKKVGMQYFMEWNMVWKDVTVGFTLAGIISAFVPSSFFETLFIGTGGDKASYGFFTLLEHAVVGPVAAFCTFIGSMGNIPLASLLYSNGVSFAGIMAFIFSDLVVFPVLRINAKYYGWKMSFYILFLLFTSLIATSILLHYGFNLFDALPESGGKNMADQSHFKINYTFFLNIAFLLVSGILAWLTFGRKEQGGGHHHHHEMADKGALESVLKYLAIVSYLWLIGGLVVKFFVLS